ncbi:MAG: dienelactone hydrolase family protein [Caulobacteraceae bacterium]|nr:dienelactone hydrolase family protein [Caulobacteraceae bacterium]
MVNLTRPEGSEPQDLHLSRRALAGLFFAGYAAAALSARAEPIVTDATGLTVETVQVSAADRQIPAYLARPSGHGPFPAVIVVSEIFGVHEYIRDICRRLAKLGYVAIAPAFFVRAGDPAPMTDMAAIQKIVQATPDRQVLGDVGATLSFLKAQDYVIPDALAITGFCWGGGIVWLACETFTDFRAGVAWYGRLAPPPGAAPDPNKLWPIQNVANLHAPVLGLYAGKDPLADAVPAMREALGAAHQTGTEIIIYPDAQHGFHADYRDSYNPADAQDGWMRMLAHFAINGAVSRHDPHNHAAKRSGRRTRPHRTRRRRGRRG